jgi:hypothetical protein
MARDRSLTASAGHARARRAVPALKNFINFGEVCVKHLRMEVQDETR